MNFDGAFSLPGSVREGFAFDPTWLNLVFKLAADFGDRFAEVVGKRVGGGE